ncbi:hypothetical protein HMSSN139_22480 [Paenibacillus sp. HMSSN-139]|nr:hypothetical protein HMSSN139_22480 [Paenibacillus sp. HMSSN-139]
MEIRAVTQETGVPWELQHSEILAFVRKYGAGRVSPAVLRALLRLTPSDLDRPGCSLLVARIRARTGNGWPAFLAPRITAAPFAWSSCIRCTAAAGSGRSCSKPS